MSASQGSGWVVLAGQSCSAAYLVHGWNKKAEQMHVWLPRLFTEQPCCPQNSLPVVSGSKHAPLHVALGLPAVLPCACGVAMCLQAAGAVAAARRAGRERLRAAVSQLPGTCGAPRYGVGVHCTSCHHRCLWPGGIGCWRCANPPFPLRTPLWSHAAHAPPAVQPPR